MLKSIFSKSGKIKILATGDFDGMAEENTIKEYINNDEVITIPSGGSANIKY
jgi:hypothetical protein